jgi:hypothetical protein
MAPGLMAAGGDISARVRRSDFIVPATCCLQVLKRNLVRCLKALSVFKFEKPAGKCWKASVSHLMTFLARYLSGACI